MLLDFVLTFQTCGSPQGERKHVSYVLCIRWYPAEPNDSSFYEIALLCAPVLPSNNPFASGRARATKNKIRGACCYRAGKDPLSGRSAGSIFCFPSRQATSGSPCVACDFAWRRYGLTLFCCAYRIACRESFALCADACLIVQRSICNFC